MKEFKHLDSWDMSITTTGLGTNPRLIKLALGCADIDSENASKIIPRADLLQTDFASIWWVGDRADGGCVAVQLKNALATAGFSLQTTKNGKGQTGITLTGHVSIAAQKDMPMVFYSIDPTGEDVAVTQNLTNVTSSFDGTSVKENDPLNVTLSPTEGYAISSVTVSMGGVDITSTVYNESTHTIAITNVTGTVVITASAEAVAETWSVTQTLTHVTSTFDGDAVAKNGAFNATLTADEDYSLTESGASVEVTMGGDDITSTAYTSADGSVAIASVTGDVVITATAVYTGA